MLGTRELVVFRPDAVGRVDSSSQVPLTVFRRTEQGALVVSYQGPGPVFSEELGVALMVVGEGDGPLLRLSELGMKALPTEAEAEEAERAVRIAAEKALAKAEAELAGARARIAELERELFGKKRQ
ncbi:MAG TPA: hypothetical protein DFS52_16900 [Myxococcales bacterium]|nr:hypothetical protein [Myxococcales bacterium]